MTRFRAAVSTPRSRATVSGMWPSRCPLRYAPTSQGCQRLAASPSKTMTETNGVSVAWLGVVGSAIGGLLTLCGTVLGKSLEERSKRKLDHPRRELIRKLLTDDRFTWRRLDTIMHVVGADAETTKRPLIEIGARGSEDGQQLGGLIERNPFPSAE
jgi:hypothetical protein